MKGLEIKPLIHRLILIQAGHLPLLYLNLDMVGRRRWSIQETGGVVSQWNDKSGSEMSQWKLRPDERYGNFE